MNQTNDCGGWIATKDALPEKHQYVFLLKEDRYWNTPEGVPEMKITAGGYLSENAGLYWSVFGERGFSLDSFTHWMPVPAAPVQRNCSQVRYE